MGAAYVTQKSSQPIQLNTNSYKDIVDKTVRNYRDKYNKPKIAGDGKDSSHNGAFADEQTVIDALNDFNNQYATYVRCNNTDPSISANCSYTDKAFATVQNKGTILKTAISTLQLDIINMDKLNNKVTPAIYDASYNLLLNNYTNVKLLRSELDSKLKELYEIPGSFVVDSKYEYDATMYSGIIFTILATSMLYFTFTRL